MNSLDECCINRREIVSVRRTEKEGPHEQKCGGGKLGVRETQRPVWLKVVGAIVWKSGNHMETVVFNWELE